MTTAVSFSLETKKVQQVWHERFKVSRVDVQIWSWTFRFYEEGGSKKTDKLLETELL